jgi:tRNA threonylcarbamoyladenosine biosynthesis protein TsaE
MKNVILSTIKSSSSEDTVSIGEQLGRRCRGGEVFMLASDLGGGKTTFVKGLAKGLGSRDHVSSPTFMVERVYSCRDDLSLHHFDFYRLQEGGIVARELHEVLDDKTSVIAVEWGQIITDTLPLDHITIRLERQANDEDHRLIQVSCPEKFSYLSQELSC